MIKQFFKIIYIGLAIKAFGTTAQSVAVPDTNLLSFLKANYPTLIDANDRLKIAEAALVRGSFTCDGQNIQDPEGIQYFTGITTLNVSNNKLRKLPELSAMKQLKQLWAYRNQITALPDLGNLGLLQELVVYENKIATLPSLLALTQLQYLDVVNNTLTELPKLDHCTKLNKLLCNNNNLSSLPKLDSLKNLVALDASHNQIGSFPNLSNNLMLETCHLNDNNLHTLPVLPYWPKLQKVWLYNNWLDFKELNKIRTYDKYKTLFQVFPMYSIPIVDRITFKENHTIVLSSHADSSVGSLSYQWFKNGNPIAQSNTPNLNIPKASLSDSGSYTCEVSCSYFPHVTLNTSTAQIKIVTCIVPSSFTVKTTEITCEQAGSVILSSQDKDIYTYTLTGKRSGKSWSSQNGFLGELAESEYILDIQTELCDAVRYPSSIIISKQNCSKALITPNGDGIQDTHFFEESGAVKIFNKRGELVKSLSAPSYWDGNTDTGLAPQGIYIVNVNDGAKMYSISVVY